MTSKRSTRFVIVTVVIWAVATTFVDAAIPIVDELSMDQVGLLYQARTGSLAFSNPNAIKMTVVEITSSESRFVDIDTSNCFVPPFDIYTANKIFKLDPVGFENCAPIGAMASTLDERTISQDLSADGTVAGGDQLNLVLLRSEPVIIAPYETAILGTKPIGYWRLNETAVFEGVAQNLGSLGVELDGLYKGSIIKDDPGPGHPGLGDDNTAMRIGEGNSDFVSTGFSFSEQGGYPEFTFSAWVNPENAKNGGLFGQQDAIEIGFLGDDLRIRSRDGAFVELIVNAAYDLDNDWHHLAVTARGECDIRVFLDGMKVDTDLDIFPCPTSHGNNQFSNSLLNIGRGILGVDDQFVGAIDEVAFWDIALTDAQIADQFNSALGEVTCDFDGDGMLDVDDIDLLSAEIQSGTNNPSFDVTGDGEVDFDDLVFFVEDASKLNTFIGDSNLDGEFNTSDFVVVFQIGEYEDSIPGNSTWAEGDWNADGDFTSGDLVLAFQRGSFEIGPRGTIAAVPEPSAFLLGWLAVAVLVKARRSASAVGAESHSRTSLPHLPKPTIAD